MPIELPTRNVAGSPTSVSNPAELLRMAISTSGPMKSTSSARAVRTTIGASRMTVVAFGSTAHSGTTIATMPSTKRLPLPRVRRRKRAPSWSNKPVGTSTRATTMPPKSSAMAPLAVPKTSSTSLPSSTPPSTSRLTPSSPATTMSIRSKAMARITPKNTIRMRMF